MKPPLGALLAEVETTKDELVAYLDFEYLRSLREIESDTVLLTSAEAPNGPTYRILLVLPRDLLVAVPRIARLEAERFIDTYRLIDASPAQLEYHRTETRFFEAVYSRPVKRRLEQLDAEELDSPLVRFLLFKSKTDRRVRMRLEPVPPVLSTEDAQQLAANVVEVARFYELPLDFFLGIGATENNYMEVLGDLAHTVWKRRAQPGDIVIARRRGRVLVRNFSVGVWQITRETLRKAHELYLNDKRDYNSLPVRLRPPRDLDLDGVSPAALTTYAGLLFRYLLDWSGGDVRKAVGAYNGGRRNPNPVYAAHVSAAAEHARKILEQAASFAGRSLAQTRFITAGRKRGT